MSAISLGVDIGSTSIKVVALDTESLRVVKVLTTPLDSRVQSTPEGHFEEDPGFIRTATFDLIRELASQFGNAVTAIAFTGQMHSGLYVDSSLEPLTNLVTWQDKRGDERSESGSSYVETLRTAMGTDETGVGIHSGFLAVTARWMAENDVRIPVGAKLIGIYDWLTSLLIGRPVTDITSAAAWGLYDIVRKSWKMEVAHAAEIDPKALPEVYEPGVPLGTICPAVGRELGLPQTAVVFSSIGDTQASFIGSGVAPSEILLNFGTGSQSMWTTNQPMATHGTDIRYLRNDRYIVTAPTLAGGKAYQILAEFFASVLQASGRGSMDHADLYDLMNRVSEDAESGGITFDPIFAGSRWKEPGARASISGLTADNFRIGQVTRALLEGMIEEVAAPYFLREKSVRHRGLVGAGNGMRRNRALRDAAEKRFGLPLRLAESEEEAARGAAILTLPVT